MAEGDRADTRPASHCIAHVSLEIKSTSEQVASNRPRRGSCIKPPTGGASAGRRRLSGSGKLMPVTYEIDKESAVIRTRCTGNVTLAEVTNHFEELARDPDCPDYLDVLLDLAEQATIPKSQELLVVTCEIAKVRGRVQFGACAIVASTDALFGMLRMFEVFTEALFREARVFRALPDAETWLAQYRKANRLQHRQRTKTSRPT